MPSIFGYLAINAVITFAIWLGSQLVTSNGSCPIHLMPVGP